MKTVITRGGLVQVSAYEGKYVTAYADGETADLVKSSQVNLLIVPKVTSTDVLANHLRAFSNYFSDSPTPAPSSG